MSVLIAIPSKRRSEILKLKTLNWMRGIRFDWKVFIEKSDLRDYEFCSSNLVVLPEQNRGLGYAKGFIKKYAIENCYSEVLKMDDDVRAWLGPDRKGISSLRNLENTIEDCLSAFSKYPDVKAIGYPYRFEMYDVKRWIAANMRLQSCYMIRTEWLLGDENLSIFEDFANYVHIRASNGLTLRYGFCGIDCDIGKIPGGHQSFDRMKQTKEAMEYLRSLYPWMTFKKVLGKSWDVEPVLKGKFYGVKSL